MSERISIQITAEYDHRQNRVDLYVGDLHAVTIAALGAVDIVGEEHACKVAVCQWLGDLEAARKATRELQRHEEYASELRREQSERADRW